LGLYRANVDFVKRGGVTREDWRRPDSLIRSNLNTKKKGRSLTLRIERRKGKWKKEKDLGPRHKPNPLNAAKGLPRRQPEK